jgi:hypothetical protein
VDREDREHRTGADVVDVGLQPGHGGEQIAVAADAGQRAHGLVVEDDLAPGALGVHHRRRASHGNGFLNAADAQFHVHRDDCRAADGQLIAANGGEAGQAEGHRIGARAQVFNPVAPVAVGDGGADFFDQRRAGRFDGDAR